MIKPPPSASLAGLSILVVEDEFLTAMMLCNEIANAGGTALGPVNSVAHAVKEIESGIVVDLVLLDAKLVDGSAEDLTILLNQRQIPYVVMSGYEKGSLPNGLGAAPFVAKPLSVPTLLEAIVVVTSKSRAAVPLPR